MLANIMTEADADTMGIMMDTIQTVGETNPDSTLALEVLSSMADSGESFDDMDFGDEEQDQYNKMMEQAVFSAADSEDGAMMLANVMTEADADTVGIMFDYILDVSENDKYSTLGAEVLSSVASTAATDDTYFDTEKMDQFYDFIDTTTYTTTTTAGDDGVADDMYDASGFSMMPPYYHRDTGTFYDNAGFDKYGNSQDDGVADDMYDAGGFSMMPPYNHRETGTLYNMAGFDRDGNSDPGAGGSSYDANGFDATGLHRDTLTLYDYGGFDRDGYHQNTGTLYNSAGLDRNGNSEDASGSDPTVTWITQASSSADASYTTSDTISLTASATTTGSGVTYSVSGEADLTFDATGLLSGSPTVANSPYSIEIVAQDSSCEPSCTGVSKITDTISFTVTDGGSYDARGFSTVTPFYHKNGTLYDDDGYNASGWSNAIPAVYNYLYDDNISP
jgi:hypothetical protein